MNQKMVLLAVVIGTVVLALALPASANSQTLNPESVAFSNLRTLQAEVNESNYKLFGLSYPTEMKQLHLGQPILYSIIPLDMLREWKQGSDPSRIIIPSPRITYPLLDTASRYVIALELDSTSAGFQLRAAGKNHSIAALTQFGMLKQQGVRLIEVPSLGRTYALSDESRKFTLMLIPLEDDRAANFMAGTPQTAESIMTSLSQSARAYNGLPR
jgi:hypothetical protein